MTYIAYKALQFTCSSYVDELVELEVSIHAATKADTQRTQASDCRSSSRALIRIKNEGKESTDVSMENTEASEESKK